ncbi:MAG: flagellar basal body rod protein FlgC [Lachnospiraceae bacterium]|nr:flagellar basal body rod protein FlgC [Lachnospiraceae bacterium]
MRVFGALNISASGMTAQQTRTDIIAQNIANANTTRDAEGKVYRRKNVVFAEKKIGTFNEAFTLATGVVSGGSNGVRITRIVEDPSVGSKVYDPTHPDADEQGYVTYPNVNIATEMTDMIDASRSYEANVTAFNATKAMITKALEMDS